MEHSRTYCEAGYEPFAGKRAYETVRPIGLILDKEQVS